MVAKTGSNSGGAARKAGGGSGKVTRGKSKGVVGANGKKIEGFKRLTKNTRVG